MSVRLTTTLYDLITAIHSVTESDEDELVVAVVMHWVMFTVRAPLPGQPALSVTATWTLWHAVSPNGPTLNWLSVSA